MKEVGYQNLAADLRRIAMWMYTGNERLTEMFLEKGLAGFGTDKRMVKGKALADWLVELKDWRRDNLCRFAPGL